MLFRLEPCGHDWPAIALGTGIEVPSACKLCGGSVYEALLIVDEAGWPSIPLARITVNLTNVAVTQERANPLPKWGPEGWDD